MSHTQMSEYAHHEQVEIPAGAVAIVGDMVAPSGAAGVVIFAHGSGSSRHSPRNRYVAGVLHASNFATLLVDLLTAGEEREDEVTRALRFDIELLAARLIAATDWLRAQPNVDRLPIGYFGASTGAAAALEAAAGLPAVIRAVVSRGGRPDLAGQALARVRAPTLLIVGGADDPVIALNDRAFQQLHAPKQLTIVPKATHLFEEPGTLEAVAGLASDWFVRYLIASEGRSE